MEENKKELNTEESVAETTTEATPVTKCGFWAFIKKWLNLGLCLFALLFAIIGKILYLAVTTSMTNSGNIANSTITAMPWMDFVALGFAVACTVLQCIKFIKNRKFEFSPEIYINLLTYVVLLIKLTFII